MDKDQELFAKTWKRSQNWIQDEDDILAFFKDSMANLGLRNVGNFLTIGPGAGTIERELIPTCLPKLRTATIVEPNSYLLADLKNNLSSFNNIQVQYHNDRIEDFAGPSTQVDFILLSHSVYYFMDFFEGEIRRWLKWLSSGGVIAMIIADENGQNLLSKLEKALPPSELLLCSDFIKETLNKADIKYKEHVIPSPVHVGNEYGKDAYLEIALNRKATDEEKRIMTETLNNYCRPGTRVIDEKQTVFIIRNDFSETNCM